MDYIYRQHIGDGDVLFDYINCGVTCGKRLKTGNEKVNSKEIK